MILVRYSVGEIEIFKLTLRDHLNGLSERTPRLAVNAMSMRGRNDVWSGFVYLRVNHETGLIDRGLVASFSDVSLSVNEDQVRGLHEGEVLCIRVHPKVILQNGVYGDNSYQYWKHRAG